MSEHYVCKGNCAATSEAPQVCKTESCDRNGQMMEACNCTDGTHETAGQAPADEEIAA